MRTWTAILSFLAITTGAAAQFPARVPPPAPPALCVPAVPRDRAALAHLLANPAALRLALCTDQLFSFYGGFAEEYRKRQPRLADPIAEVEPPPPLPESQFIIADGPVATSPSQAQITLEVPMFADVFVEGQRQEFQGTAVRVVSGRLTEGRDYVYAVRVRWTDEGKIIERLIDVPVQAGDRKVVTVVGRSR